MSWLFSRALVAASSPATCSAGAPSAPLSVMPTQHKFWRNDKTMEPCDLSRFGLTCAVLTDDHGEAVLTWCLEASRARTSALPARAQALTAPAAECGATWRASWAKFDPSTSTWRTPQPSLLGDSDESSVTWPRSGMTADGQCWELPMSAPPISGIGSGLWLQTPIAAMAKNTMRSAEFAKGRAPSPQEFVRQWPTPVASDTGSRSKPYAQGGTPLSLAVKWPTPIATDGSKCPSDSLSRAVNPALRKTFRTASAPMWPTPTVCGNHNRKGASPTSGDGLATAVLKCATPTARDWRSGKASEASEATMLRNSRPLSEQIGGSLNPPWVEWLMGWPIGWTDLKPWATDRCQPAPQQRGECLQEAEA